MLPLVLSRMILPGRSRPSASALRMIWYAARSLTLPPGFCHSALANTRTAAGSPRVMRRKLKSGVLPICRSIFREESSRSVSESMPAAKVMRCSVPALNKKVNLQVRALRAADCRCLARLCQLTLYVVLECGCYLRRRSSRV